MFINEGMRPMRYQGKFLGRLLAALRGDFMGSGLDERVKVA